MEEQREIVLDERDQVVINGAMEYAQKALNADQNDKPTEAIELYQRAIYLLQNEQQSVSSLKFKAYSLYIDAYKTRIRTLQFQLQNEISSPQLQKSSQFDDFTTEISDGPSISDKKPITKLIEDLDKYQSTVVVIKSFLTVFTEGGNLTTNLHVPCGLWIYTFEEETDIFFKDALNFYEQISAIFRDQMDENKVKCRDVDLREVKRGLTEAYKAFGQGLVELSNSEPVIMGKPMKFGRTTKIDEYASIIKRNFAKLTTTEDKYSKKILYSRVSQSVIEEFIKLIEYADEEIRLHNTQEVKNNREFIYVFGEEVLVKLLLYETKLKLNVYFSRMKERLC